MYNYKARITNVVDGDTFDLDIDLGFHIHIHERVRLLNVDCPEKNARNGELEKKAGKYVTTWACNNLIYKEVEIISHKDTDSFGRWLVDMNVDWGDGYTNLVYTYNAKGFNKLDKDYSLDNLIRQITEEEIQKSKEFAF